MPVKKKPTIKELETRATKLAAGAAKWQKKTGGATRPKAKPVEKAVKKAAPKKKVGVRGAIKRRGKMLAKI